MPVYNYTTFDDPSATIGTFANSINDTGQIVGHISDAVSSHGFLLSGGTFTTLDDPLATGGTFAEGINDAGQIVGFYQNASGNHGFLLSGGTYTTLDDPSATSGTGSGTVANGINDAGQIVGFYQNATGTGIHGFLLTITPNPSPPAGTTALMIMSNPSDGTYEIYNVGGNAI